MKKLLAVLLAVMLIMGVVAPARAGWFIESDNIYFVRVDVVTPVALAVWAFNSAGKSTGSGKAFCITMGSIFTLDAVLNLFSVEWKF